MLRRSWFVKHISDWFCRKKRAAAQAVATWQRRILPGRSAQVC